MAIRIAVQSIYSSFHSKPTLFLTNCRKIVFKSVCIYGIRQDLGRCTVKQVDRCKINDKFKFNDRYIIVHKKVRHSLGGAPLNQRPR